MCQRVNIGESYIFYFGYLYLGGGGIDVAVIRNNRAWDEMKSALGRVGKKKHPGHKYHIV